MSITLTGHRGLVGSAIAENIELINYEDKITDLCSYKKFINDNNIQTIIHAAARVGGVLDNYKNKINFYLENSKLNNIVFEAAYTSGVNNFINFSSVCVFPDECEHPLKEENIFNGPPHYTNDSYAYAKRMNQHLCSEARKEGKNYFTIIPTNAFGPGDNYHLDKSHVLPGLIHKCYLAKKHNLDLNVWGNGKSLREFIYSKDLAKITCDLLKTPHNYDSIIVSNSEEVSIEYCVDLIVNIMGFKGKVVFDKSKPNGQSRRPTDTSRLKSIFPDFQFTPFEDALAESIDWFLINYRRARI